MNSLYYAGSCLKSMYDHVPSIALIQEVVTEKICGKKTVRYTHMRPEPFALICYLALFALARKGSKPRENLDGSLTADEPLLPEDFGYFGDKPSIISLINSIDRGNLNVSLEIPKASADLILPYKRIIEIATIIFPPPPPPKEEKDVNNKGAVQEGKNNSPPQNETSNETIQSSQAPNQPPKEPEDSQPKNPSLKETQQTPSQNQHPKELLKNLQPQSQTRKESGKNSQAQNKSEKGQKKTEAKNPSAEKGSVNNKPDVSTQVNVQELDANKEKTEVKDLIGKEESNDKDVKNEISEIKVQQDVADKKVQQVAANKVVQNEAIDKQSDLVLTPKYLEAVKNLYQLAIQGLYVMIDTYTTDDDEAATIELLKECVAVIKSALDGKITAEPTGGPVDNKIGELSRLIWQEQSYTIAIANCILDAHQQQAKLLNENSEANKQSTETLTKNISLNKKSALDLILLRSAKFNISKELNDNLAYGTNV